MIADTIIWLSLSYLLRLKINAIFFFKLENWFPPTCTQYIFQPVKDMDDWGFSFWNHTDFQSRLNNKSMPECYFYDDRELGSEYGDLEGKRNTLLISIDLSMKWVSKDSSIKPKEVKDWEKRFGLDVWNLKDLALCCWPTDSLKWR